jgi:hypothetical protein
MASPTPSSLTDSEQALLTNSQSMSEAVGAQKMRRIFSGAKASLPGGSSLSLEQMGEAMRMYRRIEKELFGVIAPLPGEEAPA